MNCFVQLDLRIVPYFEYIAASLYYYNIKLLANNGN